MKTNLFITNGSNIEISNYHEIDLLSNSELKKITGGNDGGDDDDADDVDINWIP